jgi:hypothetical protein
VAAVDGGVDGTGELQQLLYGPLEFGALVLEPPGRQRDAAGELVDPPVPLLQRVAEPGEAVQRAGQVGAGGGVGVGDVGGALDERVELPSLAVHGGCGRAGDGGQVLAAERGEQGPQLLADPLQVRLDGRLPDGGAAGQERAGAQGPAARRVEAHVVLAQ